MSLRERLSVTDEERQHQPVAAAAQQAYAELKKTMHQMILDRIDLERLKRLTSEQFKHELALLVQRIIEEERIVLNQQERHHLVLDIQHEMLGFGPLEPLLGDPSISDILVNTYDKVYVERRGRLELTDVSFHDNAHLMKIIEKIVSRVGRRVDESSPMVDARLPDGSRVNAIIPPLAVDGPFLESCLVHVAPGFGVLAAADDPGQTTEAKPEHIDTILRVARQHYDYILLDVGRQIDAVSLRALDSTDAIYPVLQLALPDIRDARRLLDIFRSLGYLTDHIRLIVNRYEKGGKLRLADLHAALGAEVLHTVPNDYIAVTDSVNQGIPVLQLSRGSAAARSLADLVEMVTARRIPETKGLFDRLFGRNEDD
jgi:hypothetical protein